MSTGRLFWHGQHVGSPVLLSASWLRERGSPLGFWRFRQRLVVRPMLEQARCMKFPHRSHTVWQMMVHLVQEATDQKPIFGYLTDCGNSCPAWAIPDRCP